MRRCAAAGILAAAAVLARAPCGRASRIALVSSSDAPPPGLNAGPWASDDAMWADWEWILHPHRWQELWRGHPVSGLFKYDGKYDKHPKRRGVTQLWRVMTARINAAYAAAHGYDAYFLQLAPGGCPQGRAANWCAHMAAMPLLDMLEDGGEVGRGGGRA